MNLYSNVIDALLDSTIDLKAVAIYVAKTRPGIFLEAVQKAGRPEIQVAHSGKSA